MGWQVFWSIVHDCYIVLKIDNPIIKIRERKVTSVLK